MLFASLLDLAIARDNMSIYRAAVYLFDQSILFHEHPHIFAVVEKMYRKILLLRPEEPNSLR